MDVRVSFLKALTEPEVSDLCDGLLRHIHHNRFDHLTDAQLYASLRDATRSHGWRIEPPAPRRRCPHRSSGPMCRACDTARKREWRQRRRAA